MYFLPPSPSLLRLEPGARRPAVEGDHRAPRLGRPRLCPVPAQGGLSPNKVRRAASLPSLPPSFPRFFLPPSSLPGFASSLSSSTHPFFLSSLLPFLLHVSQGADHGHGVHDAGRPRFRGDLLREGTSFFPSSLPPSLPPSTISLAPSFPSILMTSRPLRTLHLTLPPSLPPSFPTR